MAMSAKSEAQLRRSDEYALGLLRHLGLSVEGVHKVHVTFEAFQFPVLTVHRYLPVEALDGTDFKVFVESWVLGERVPSAVELDGAAAPAAGEVAHAA